MVQKIAAVAFASMVMVTGMRANAQTDQLQEAQQALKDVLFADDQLLRSIPELEEVALFDDLGLEGFEEFFAIDENAPDKTTSAWDLYREQEYGVDDDELNLRQRMRLVGLLLRDTLQMATTFVNVEINRMRVKFSGSLSTVWDQFVQETYDDKDALSAKEKAQVVGAMARSYSAAICRKAFTGTVAAGKATASATTRGSVAAARYVNEKAPVAAASAYEQTCNFAKSARDNSVTFGNYVAGQTRRAGVAVKRGSAIATRVVSAGVRSAHETLREELN